MNVQTTTPQAPTEHVHRIKYLPTNTIGLAKSRGENEPYVNVIMGRTVVLPSRDECEAAGCGSR